MKNFDNIKFIRWGNLNPRKHKEARLSDDKKTYHTAPCYKGIYAFPEGLVEPFLLGGVKPVNGKIQNRYFFLKDEDGNRITTDELYDFDEDYNESIKPKYIKLLKDKGLKRKDLSSEYVDDGKWCVTYVTNKHTFSYRGNIWHHLELNAKKKEIIDRKGSWVLSRYDDYIKILKRTVYKERFESYMHYRKYNAINGNPHSCPSYYSRDHFEVFIEKIK